MDIASLLYYDNLELEQLKTKRSTLEDLVYTNNPQKLYLQNPGLRSGITTQCCYIEQNFHRGPTEFKALLPTTKILYLFYPLLLLFNDNPKWRRFD